MNGQFRPLGIAMSLVGNTIFAIGFGTLIRTINDVSAAASGFDWTDFVPLGRPAAMLAVGYTMLRFAPRFGGGSLGVQFFLIGATSMWGAFHTTDGVERFVNATIGGTFLFVSVLGLVSIAMVYGWKHSLTHPSPVVLRRGGVAQPLTLANLGDALREAANPTQPDPGGSAATPAASP
ncbi:MAG: hypothetical protein ACJ71Z_00365 [Aeromicrobium sp.]